MINNSAKVEAFKSFYLQAKSLYSSGNKSDSKDLFLKAASLANEISLDSSSYQVRMEYHAQAEKILNFLKYDFNKVPVTSTKNEETPSFKAEDSNTKKITFKDVAGLDDVKDEIIFNVIEPLRNPLLASSYNITPGAKIMLYGPPGTGKTFIARAIAGEVDAAFYAINCQDLISKYVGESSKQIDKLFEEAESHKRAIIFFDEFDAIASKREAGGGEADSEISRFVASFLTKVDGFKKKEGNEMLLLIAATNRPWAIDKAMLRGGRFDTHIYVGLPDVEARKFLINKELRGLKANNDVSLNQLAMRLDNYGGADIVSACRKIKSLAYRRAVKSQRYEPISMNDVEEVLSKMHVSVTPSELEDYRAFKEGEF